MARRRGRNRIRRQAKRDVNLAIRPQLRELGRQRRTARREYQDYDAKVGNLYGILDQTLGGANTQQQQALSQIGQQYGTGVQDILGGLGQSTAPDQAAFLNTLGSFALAGQNALSTDAAREANLGSSMRRQGGLERTQIGRNLRGDLQDAFEDIRFARRGIMADRGPMLMQRLDQLRNEAFSRNMARQELALRRAAVNRELGNDAAMAGFVRDFGSDVLEGSGQRKKKKGRRRKPRGGSGGTAIATGGDKRRQ